MTPRLAAEVLGPEDLAAVDTASRRVLAETGIRVRGRELLESLEKRGLEVDRDRGRITFSSAQVDEALRRSPREIPLFDRDGSLRFTLGGDNPPRFAAGFNATFTLDGPGGERRPAVRTDVEQYARVSQHLEEIDMVGTQVVPHDVPAGSALLHAAAAVLDNTVKPILFSPENEGETAALIEIVAVAAGGRPIGDKPIGICQFSPSSPLFWNESTLKGFLSIVGEGFPCTILPGPLAGATAPFTLAGTLVQRNCEVLAAVVVAQRVNPGAPLLCYNGGGQFDMRTQSAVLGSPEAALMLMAGTQLARHYGLPTHGCIPSSDSHCLDEQVGFENALLYLAGLFSRTDLMVNAGLLACGQTASLEQLVVDSQFIRVLRRFADGIKVNSERLCVDAIARVGPGGNYLEDPSTLANLRSGEWAELELLNRENHDRWREGGGRSIVERARTVCDRALREEASRLGTGGRAAIAEIIARHERAGARHPSS